MKAGLTKTALAKMASISRETIDRGEKGESISLENLIKIAETLGIHPGDFFITEDDKVDIKLKTKKIIEKLFSIMEE